MAAVTYPLHGVHVPIEDSNVEGQGSEVVTDRQRQSAIPYQVPGRASGGSRGRESRGGSWKMEVGVWRVRVGLGAGG